MSLEEFLRLAEEAEGKAKATTDPIAKRLWHSVAEEWREAEKSARVAGDGMPHKHSGGRS
jgi:hypothetical protein